MSAANSVSPDSATEVATNSHARLIDVLDALTRRTGAEPWGVRELAAELGESRTTVNRILGALVERGLATEVGAGKYGVGARLEMLSDKLRQASPLFSWADAELDRLAEASASPVLLSICCPTREHYFVANFSSARSSLTFRPELGVPYPLTFGDIGRHFARTLDKTTDEGLAYPSMASPGKAASRPRDSAPLLAESEYPRARTLISVPVASGLIACLSVHPLEPSAIAANAGDEEARMLAFAQRLAARTHAHEALTKSDVPDLPTGNAKLTAARFERLLLLHCLFPQGIVNIVHCHDRLLCNTVTAARLVQSAVSAEITNVKDSIAFPGPRLFQWTAKLGVKATHLADWIRPIINGLVQRTGETVALLAFDEVAQRSQFLEVIQGWRPIQYQLQTHVDVPLYAGAAGKAVLAHCEPELVATIELRKLTDATITSREALEADLANIRHRGWASGDGERVPGAFGVATPFFENGRVRGAISATVPRYRKDDLNIPELAMQLLEASRKITAILST